MLRSRLSVLLALSSILVSLMVAVPSGIAQATPSIPALQWPAVNTAPFYGRIVTSPNGNVTVGCSTDGSGQDLVTYSSTGAVVSQISRTSTIDGVANCIGNVVVDKNGGVYGVPYGQYASGGWGYGPNLLAYSGKLLAQPSGVSNPSYAKIGATGRLFSYSTVGGSFTSVAVSAYDPRSGQTTWTTIASTSGANTNGAWLYPIAGGGVVVIVKEQKMIGGMPASPTQWVYAMTTLNALGVKVQSVQLPQVDASGNAYDTMAPTVVADTTGKILMIRQLLEAIVPSGSYPSTVPAVIANVIDPASGTVTYSGVWRGNNDRSVGQLNGYVLDYTGDNGPVSSSGTAFLQIRCYNSCTDTRTKLYPAVVSGLGMDYPRGEVLTANMPAQPTPVPADILGDSYSSGQGASVYDNGTVTSTNRCYKSLNAYGRNLSRDPYTALSVSNFVACGGAVTTDIHQTSTYSGVPRQNTALSSASRIVTITIGGNDIGFANVIKTCADPTKDCDGAFNGAMALLGSIFDNKLQAIYLDILQKAPNATIYVVSYPPIFVAGSSGCLVGDNGSSTPFFGADRIQKGVTLLDSLNSAIQANVNAIRSLGANYQRLRFVDATAPSSPFSGHDVCSSTPYINGLILPPSDTAESFHPNSQGQQAYATLVKNALAQVA